jgi:ABC-type proline/glycine betaine transport system ATPase subunit
VLVTHRLDEAVGLIDHLVLLRRGRIRHQQAWTGGSLKELSDLYAAHLDEST